MAEAFARPFSAGGGKILSLEWVRDGQRDFTSFVKAAIPAEADLVFYGGSFEGAYILKAMRHAGLNQLFAAGDGCWDRWNFLDPVCEVANVGEGVLVLSATSEIGRVAGSREFSDRYARQYGPIGNYAVNSYDTARLLLMAIEDAARTARGMPDREQVFSSLKSIHYQGIAYPSPVHWDEKGDNIAAVTALHVVEDDGFRQIAQVPST